MEVVDKLVSDVAQLSSIGAFSLFFLVTSGRVDGKSTALSLFADKMKENEGTCAGASLVDLLESEAELKPTFHIAPLFYDDLHRAANALRKHQQHHSDNTGSHCFPLLTVVVIDDLDTMWSLCVMNNSLGDLKCIISSVLSSPQCALVAAASHARAVPMWISNMKPPLVYPIPPVNVQSGPKLLTSLLSEAAQREADGVALPEVTLSYPISRGQILSAACTLAEGLKPSCSFCSDSSTHEKVAARPRLYGLDEVEERVHSMIDVFCNRNSRDGQCGALLSAVPPTTGILLHGPTGCGKTALAHAMSAAFPGVSFQFVSCPSLFSKFLGQSEERLRRIYAEARSRAPAVVVLDDVDVIAQSRGAFEGGSGGGGGVDVTKRMLAGLLCELDGVGDSSGVLTIGLTNAPQMLDGALLRQGRLETILLVPPLSTEAVQLICSNFFNCFDGEEGEKKAFVTQLTQRAEKCSYVSLKYVLRKIFERAVQLTGWQVAQMPLPPQAVVDSILFECLHILMRPPYQPFPA